MACFVTACVRDRECLFGEVIDHAMRLNDAGRMVRDVWCALPERFPTLGVDAFVIMPNHVHGVIFLGMDPAPTTEPAIPPILGAIMGAFKSISAIRINRALGRTGRSLWQRNYYEHIIRNETALTRVRRYIEDNPSQWPSDPENPQVEHIPVGEPWAPMAEERRKINPD